MVCLADGVGRSRFLRFAAEWKDEKAEWQWTGRSGRAQDLQDNFVAQKGLPRRAAI